MTLALLPLGLLAGVLTTIAGQGGGLMLLLACSLLLGPSAALAITSPALLLGNLHRAILFRRQIDRPIAKRMIAGALPGAILGGLSVHAIPVWLFHVLLVLLTLLTIAKAVRLLTFRVPRVALVPSGLVLGAMTGTVGGAGVLLSPILLSMGLTGGAFVGTMSTIAVAMHGGRVASYLGMGLFSRELFLSTALVTAAIFAGNFAGERLRTLIPERRIVLLEYVTLVVCVTLSVAGFG